MEHLDSLVVEDTVITPKKVVPSSDDIIITVKMATGQGIILLYLTGETSIDPCNSVTLFQVVLKVWFSVFDCSFISGWKWWTQGLVCGYILLANLLGSIAKMARTFPDL